MNEKSVSETEFILFSVSCLVLGFLGGKLSNQWSQIIGSTSVSMIFVYLLWRCKK